MENPEIEHEEHTFWDHHRFLLLVGLAIIISLGLVSISVSIYNTSGAAQLDLSRPGYQSVITDNSVTQDNLTTYPQSGPTNAATVKDFQTQFNKQVTSVEAVDAFGGDPLDPSSLNIGSTSNDTAANQ